MRTMILCDLITMKRNLIQTFCVCAVVAFALSLGMGTPVAGAAAVAAMAPFMYLFTTAAYDEQNGWERFRLTLPISKRSAVLGRYASVLIAMLAGVAMSVIAAELAVAVVQLFPFGEETKAAMSWDAAPLTSVLSGALLSAAVIMLAIDVALPLLLGFGMTSATRLIPIVFLLVICGGIGILGNTGMLDGIMGGLIGFIDTESEGAIPMLAVGAWAASLVVYALSCAVGIKLYERREL